MNDLEMYIDGARVVLSDKQIVAPTYQAFDVGDITKVKFDFTNTFTLPYNNNNNIIFENSFKVQSRSDKRFKDNSCKIIKGGREILPDGIAEYIESNEKGYVIVCYSRPLAFFNFISELSIRDLDYSGYEHNNDIATIIASQLNTSLYSYPLIDWHVDSPNDAIRLNERLIDVRYMAPTLFYHEILKNIFIEAGYLLINNTESHPMFQQYDLIFTTDNKNNYLQFYQSKVPYNNSGIGRWSINDKRNTGFLAVNEDEIFIGADKLVTTQEQEWNVFSSFPDLGVINKKMKLMVITPLDTGEYNIIFSTAGINVATVTGFGVGVALTAVLFEQQITQNNLVEAGVFQTRAFNAPTSTNTEIKFDFDITTTLDKDKRYSIIFTIDVNASTTQVSFTNVNVVATNFEIKKTKRNIKSIVPDIKQTDFIKNYLQLTGSILTFDKYKNTFTIERFDKIIENKGMAKDWSSKIYDNSKKPSIRHKIGKYGISNALRYALDENESKTVQADGFINSSNQNLNKSFEVLELLFASSFRSVLLQNIAMAKVPIYEGKTAEIKSGNQPIIIPAGQKVKSNIVPRILLMRKENVSSNPVGFFNEDPLFPTLASTVAISHFIDEQQTYSLGFGSNMIDTFYQWLKAILNDPIVLEEGMKLNANDVKGDELDFLIPIYFNQHNLYFYLNKIESFLENKKTKTEFIKI